MLANYFKIQRRFTGEAPGGVASLCEALTRLDNQAQLQHKGLFTRSYDNWFYRYGTWVAKSNQSPREATLTLRRRGVVRGADSEIRFAIQEKPGGGCTVKGRVRMLYQSWLPLLVLPGIGFLVGLRAPNIGAYSWAVLVIMIAVMWFFHVKNREKLFRNACSAGKMLLVDE